MSCGRARYLADGLAKVDLRLTFLRASLQAGDVEVARGMVADLHRLLDALVAPADEAAA